MLKRFAVPFVLAAAVLSARPIAAADDLLIGVGAPLSGQFSVFGKQIRDGARQAVKEINSAGGLFDRKLKLKFADTACSKDKAEAIANQMVGSGVAAVIGHFCSRSSILAAPVYRKANIVMISPASPNAKFTAERPDPKGGTYRVGYRADELWLTTIRFLETSYKGKRIATIHDNSAYGKEYVEKVRAEFDRIGVREVLRDEFKPSQTEYRALVSKIEASAVDVILIGGFHVDVATMVREIKKRHMPAAVLTGDASYSYEMIGLLGDDTGEVYVVAPKDPYFAKTAEGTLERLKAARVQPSGYFLNAYEAVRIWYAAALRAESVAYDAVVESLNTRLFRTAFGDIRFDGQGNWSWQGFTVYRIKSGEFIAY